MAGLGHAEKLSIVYFKDNYRYEDKRENNVKNQASFHAIEIAKGVYFWVKRRVMISLLHLLHFLASELGQALDDILPGLIAIGE